MGSVYSFEGGSTVLCNRYLCGTATPHQQLAATFGVPICTCRSMDAQANSAACSLCVSWYCDGYPKLLEKAKKIGEEPSLGDFSGFDTQQVEARPLHMVACSRDPFEFASVRALDCVPNTNLAPLGDDVINCHV